MSETKRTMGENDMVTQPSIDNLTLRDYFAAHAPAEPQPWFTPSLPARPELVFAHSPRCECGECEMAVNYRELAGWQKERDRQRYVQWPYAWADSQIQARKR